MTQAAREHDVLAAVVALVDTLLDDFDVVELLTELTQRCAHLLDVTSAGPLLGDTLRRLHLVAATSDRTEELELFQLQADEGPCRDCYFTGAGLGRRPARDRRALAAVLRRGIARRLRLRTRPAMHAAGTVLGALGLFGTQQGALNDNDLVVARTLAHVASVAILQGTGSQPETVLANLRRALSSRVVIEQAKGFLHERLDLPLDAAFALLRQYANQRQLHLTDVARQLITNPDKRSGLVAELAEMSAAP